MPNFRTIGIFMNSFLLAVITFAQTSDAQPVPIPLHVAVAEGKVSVQAECIGGATGDRLKVYVQRKVQAELHLTVSAGTVFSAVGANVQSLAVVQMKGKLAPGNRYYRGSVMVLGDNQRHGYLMQTVCIDYHRSSASVGQRYQLEGLDARCARILSSTQASSSLWAFQAAVWMDRAGVAQADLQRRFHISQEDISSAREILARAEQNGVESLARLSLSAEAVVHAERLFSSNPRQRSAAYTEIKKLSDADQSALETLVNLNILRDGKLPSAVELRAGNTLESLMPEGLDLPRLQIQQSLDGVLEAANALRNGPSSATEGIGSGLDRSGAPDQLERGLRGLKLATQLRALQSKRALVRAAAVRGLGRAQNPHAVEALILALADESPHVQSAASRSLEKLTGESFGDDQEKWTTWWEDVSERFEFD